ncbi:MAG: hypothetical protein VSS75_001875 [Candidatus Parabeggiatoa sp.]|nr:hypothetical protein [Candidatus Parabeggiatoa sp.]
MNVEASGVILVDSCHVQTERCVAKKQAPITAVWTSPGRTQVNVCRPCLEEKIRAGEWAIQGARVEQRADVAVYSKEKQLQLVVEVKKNPNEINVESQNWATQIRKNLFVHAGIPSTPYFLLADIPDYLYLWQNREPVNFDKAPDYIIKAKEILANYLNQAPSDSGISQYYYLEQAISSWLNEVVQSKISLSENPSLKWLSDSGLYEAIKSGSVVMESTVAA